ncbi:hypothetical protein FOXB_16508, partial [Fusarium oxysporum f. sp. conglutinans Fo5176]
FTSDPLANDIGQSRRVWWQMIPYLYVTQRLSDNWRSIKAKHLINPPVLDLPIDMPHRGDQQKSCDLKHTAPFVSVFRMQSNRTSDISGTRWLLDVEAGQEVGHLNNQDRYLPGLQCSSRLPRRHGAGLGQGTLGGWFS